MHPGGAGPQISYLQLFIVLKGKCQVLAHGLLAPPALGPSSSPATNGGQGEGPPSDSPTGFLARGQGCCEGKAQLAPCTQWLLGEIGLDRQPVVVPWQDKAPGSPDLVPPLNWERQRVLTGDELTPSLSAVLTLAEVVTVPYTPPHFIPTPRRGLRSHRRYTITSVITP